MKRAHTGGRLGLIRRRTGEGGRKEAQGDGAPGAKPSDKPIARMKPLSLLRGLGIMGEAVCGVSQGPAASRRLSAGTGPATDTL